jgi:hypothetical protein
MIDLRAKQNAPEHRRHARPLIERTKNAPNKTRFKAGDVIEFWSGYNDDIRYKSEVIAIENGDIFVLWDCYWSPIRDEPRRDIVLVSRKDSQHATL